MKIVWDEPKRTANLEKHKLDFADLTPAFFERAAFRPGHSGRWRAIGLQGAPQSPSFSSRLEPRRCLSSACGPPERSKEVA